MVLLVQRWMEGQRRAALDRGPHKSTMAHVPFLREEFDLVVGKWHWVVLPYSVAKELPGLRLSLQGLKEERDRWLWWLEYSSYSNLNYKNVPISALSAMQYGRFLDQLIREVVISDPALGPVHALKVDVSGVLYE